jgi:sulfur carrier protein ThiS
MRLNVKLFGTLGQGFQGYRQEDGLNVEIPDGAQVSDLLGHLELSVTKGCVVVVEGRVIKPTGFLENGMAVHILQAGAGG